MDKEKIEIKLKYEVVNLIENEGVTTFYNGNKGAFDGLCAHCVNEIKKDYQFIKLYWILPYPILKEDKYSLNNFDETLYPALEKVSKRFAIVRRNEWVINNSDFLISYVRHSWGGAYRTLKYAEKKQNIMIISI